MINTFINLMLAALLIVSFVSIFARRIKLPYTLALVFAGLALTFFESPLGKGVTDRFPELLLTIFLPALLFEGAMGINHEDLFKNIKTVSLLSIVGVILSVLIIGCGLHYLLGLSWAISLVFGALISPTDPVAVLKVFKDLGISKRLSTIVEAEALFNDGTGIVIFKIIVALVATGVVNAQTAILQFVQLTFGGIVLGLLIGYVVSRILKSVDDRMVQISLTTVAAYGGYIIAESLGISGVITVATTGIIVGMNMARHVSPSSRLAIQSFWEYIGFILNSAVFLLIGMEMGIGGLVSNIWLILAAFLIVITARLIYTYVISTAITHVDDARIINGVNEKIPPKWIPAIAWGGLHGGLSMVLALSVSPQLGIDKPMLLNLSFGVVFFSLLIQGLSMTRVLKSLKLIDVKKDMVDYEFMVAKLVSVSGAEREIDKLYESKIISRKVHGTLMKEVKSKKEEKEQLLEKFIRDNKELEQKQITEAKKAVLIARKSAIIKGMKEGLFREEVGEELIADIDRELVM